MSAPAAPTPPAAPKTGGGLWRSTLVVSAMTMLSRIAGLVRDMVYLNLFGANRYMDAFLVAFKIPNFLRRLFAEGSFSQAFVPVISEYKHKRSQDEVQKMTDKSIADIDKLVAEKEKDVMSV